MNINGEAGTGKFYLIAVLFSMLSKLTAIAGKPSLLVKAAPTSVTVFGING